jgi:hypothetical protein
MLSVPLLATFHVVVKKLFFTKRTHFFFLGPSKHFKGIQSVSMLFKGLGEKNHLPQRPRGAGGQPPLRDFKTL